MCWTCLLKLKTNWHFAKWDGFYILFAIQYIQCFKNFWGSANVILQIPLKMGKKWFFFSNGHIRNVVSTMPHFDNVVSTLSNIFQFIVEKHNVVSTLFNVVNFSVDIHNVVSTLIWHCATSRRHLNLKKTLNRRWNVCWDYSIGKFYKKHSIQG